MTLRHVLLLAVILGGCSSEQEGRLLGTLERDRLELVAESQEPIVEIAVTEGERVTAGQRLLQLDPASADAAFAQAEAAARQAEQRLAELVTGPRREEILAARATLSGALARLEAARLEYERIEPLVQGALLPASQLDRQRGVRDSAAAEAEAAREGLRVLERGTRSEVVDQAQSALDAARARQRQLALDRERLAVVAPRDAIVDALPYELGERPPRGAPVVVLLADGAPYARVFVPEPIRARVAAGMAATVHVDGSDRRWQAELRYVSSDAAFTPYYALNERDRSRLAFLAEVVLTEPDATSLPTGMPVEVELALEAGGP